MTLKMSLEMVMGYNVMLSWLLVFVMCIGFRYMQICVFAYTYEIELEDLENCENGTIKKKERYSYKYM